MTPAQRKKWLEERRTGIGGSDAAASVGRSRWTTRYMLWEDKLGLRESEETPAMKWGTLKEPLIRQEYANQTGRQVEVPRKILRHERHRFMLVNLDGIASASRVFEAKTSRSDDEWGPPGSDEVPQEYVFQVQHAMAVTGLEVADIAVLIGSSDFRVYEVPADPELQELLIEQEAEFWNLVQRRIPPAAETPEDVRRRWRTGKDASVMAPPAVLEAAQKLAIAKAQIDFLKDFEDRTKAEIQAFMRDNSALADDTGNLLATWKNSKPAQKFDLDSFKVEHPDLYAQYLKSEESKRPFLLKLKANLPCPPLPLNPTSIAQNPATETETAALSGPKDTASAPSPSSKGSRRKSKAV